MWIKHKAWGIQSNILASLCSNRRQQTYHHGDHFVMFRNTESPLGGSDNKESACNVGDLGLIPRQGRSPGEGHGNPLQYSCLENPHGQRSLVGYSPQGHKELYTTKRLSTAHAVHLKLMYYCRSMTLQFFFKKSIEIHV